jgi:Carboxypeptidase regulatory-like domain
MRSRSFVTLSLLWVLLGSASAVRSQTVSDRMFQPHSRTISGIVINSVTGQPIARALVQTGEHAMLTDGEGRFEFRDVISANVFANKPGYFAENSGRMHALMQAASHDADPLEIRLVPEAILSGHVTDPSGAPLEGVSVRLRALTVSYGLKHWEQRGGTTTNAEGEFRVAELQAGEYAIQTALKLDGPPEGDAAAGYAPADYPVLGANGAGALQVHAGDQLEAEISTRLEKLYPVSIAVNGLSESTFPNFTVRTAGGVEINTALQMSRQTGMFQMLLPSGSFEVHAIAYELAHPIQLGEQRVPNRVLRQFMAKQSVTVAGGPVSGLRMTLEPMAAVPLEVALEKTAKPQASDANPLQFNFSLLSAGAEAAPVGYPAESMDPAHPAQGLQTGDPLVIRNLPPGQYVLQGGGQQPWYIASAVCGGTDLTREPFTIAGSAAGCSMRLVLRDDAASLQVQVSSAVPNASEERPASAYVYMVTLNNLTRDVQTLLTGTDGKVSLDGVAPGQYLLLATPLVADLAFRDAESLRRYETEGKRIDLSPGEKTEIRLDVIHGEP